MRIDTLGQRAGEGGSEGGLGVRQRSARPMSRESAGCGPAAAPSRYRAGGARPRPGQQGRPGVSRRAPRSPSARPRMHPGGPQAGRTRADPSPASPTAPLVFRIAAGPRPNRRAFPHAARRTFREYRPTRPRPDHPRRWEGATRIHAIAQATEVLRPGRVAEAGAEHRRLRVHRINDRIAKRGPEAREAGICGLLGRALVQQQHDDLGGAGVQDMTAPKLG